MQSGFIKSRSAASAIAPFSLAAFTATRNQVTQANGNAVSLAGVSDSLGGQAGFIVDLQLTELADVRAGGVIAAGDPITSDPNGLGVKAVKVAGATVFCIGIAQEPAVLNDIIPVLLSPFVIAG